MNLVYIRQKGLDKVPEGSKRNRHGTASQKDHLPVHYQLLAGGLGDRTDY